MRQGLLDAVSLQRMLYDALDQSDDSVLILEQVGSGADGVVVASVNGAVCPDGLQPCGPGRPVARFADCGQRRSGALSCATGKPARRSGSACT
jgi:hypothetical protein